MAMARGGNRIALAIIIAMYKLYMPQGLEESQSAIDAGETEGRAGLTPQGVHLRGCQVAFSLEQGIQYGPPCSGEPDTATA